MKILIAEDEMAIGNDYKLILESRNHQVILARDGEQCVLAYEKVHRAMHSEFPSTEDRTPFDLVVLDFRMPKKDGVDVAKHILTICPRQRIIFATAYTLDALDGLMKKIQRSVEVLQKPFDLDAFADMIEDVGPKHVAGQNA
ncbi:MAG: response regulator [Nitrososphaera sp.]